MIKNDDKKHKPHDYNARGGGGVKHFKKHIKTQLTKRIKDNKELKRKTKI